MEKFIVKGEVRLNGNVCVGGAKNAALPIMAATVLGGGVHVLRNVPHLRDIRTMQDILTLLGAKIKRSRDALIIDTADVCPALISESLMREMRASVFLLGPLIGRFHEAQLSYPGGCAIGPRPIDLHIQALKRMGATVNEAGGMIAVLAPQLTGAEIVLDFPSVGATENAMMTAVLAEGTTVLRNAAREPEIIDLQDFLNKMGAKVRGAGTDTVQIDGVRRLVPAEHVIMPDRIEAGTFLIAAAITRGEVAVQGALPEHLWALLDKLSAMGASVSWGKNFIHLRAQHLKGVDIKTLPFPGFPTDLQAPMLSLLTQAEGTSVVTETIFENRFQHVDQLARMGAKIRAEGRSAIIRGACRLTGAPVEAFDLRAGGALILAALAAQGVSEIHSIHHIDRGYEAIEEKLRTIGAEIIRTDET